MFCDTTCSVNNSCARIFSDIQQQHLYLLSRISITLQCLYIYNHIRWLHLVPAIVLLGLLVGCAACVLISLLAPLIYTNSPVTKNMQNRTIKHNTYTIKNILKYLLVTTFHPSTSSAGAFAPFAADFSSSSVLLETIIHPLNSTGREKSDEFPGECILVTSQCKDADNRHSARSTPVLSFTWILPFFIATMLINEYATHVRYVHVTAAYS